MNVTTHNYLEIKNVSLKYNEVRALENINIQVSEGSIVSLIGSNGAGKSSILRAITGLRRVFQGEISYQGSVINSPNILVPTHEIVHRGVVMVPEGRRIFPYMSIKDNLLMGAYSRTDKVQIKEDLERVYQRFPRLFERQRQQGSSLSGGEQQMVAIGRALMAKPKLLLLDEPSLGIAPQIVRLIAKSLIEVNQKENITIVLVEQNSRMALAVSTYSYVLETGHIALEGKSKDLMDNEHIKKIYLGG